MSLLVPKSQGGGVIKNTSDGQIVYKNVSKSTFRYELVLGYQSNMGRVVLISASLRDREKNKILGTYRWTWDRMFPAPTPDEAVEQIDLNLLSKIFR